MILGKISDLQKALGAVSETYACALKRAAGYHGTRYFDVEAVIKFRRDNPNWKMTDVYPRRQPRNHANHQPATAGKSGGQ